MKRLLSILALAFVPIICSAQVIVVKAGADGKVFEPATLTLAAPIITGGFSIAGAITPATNDGSALGSASLSFSDLFLASGAVVNYANGNVVLTHTSGVLTLGTGNLIITTAGTAAGSVVTTTGTQTLTNKTLTTPVIASISNGGTVTIPSGADTLVARTSTDTLTNKTLTAPVITAGVVTPAVTTVTGDGAITIASGVVLLTKAGVSANTVAAPSSQDGTRMTITSTTANAHVVTFTGGTLLDGTDGANTTATFAAFPGASITVIAVGTTWHVESLNAVTCAP